MLNVKELQKECLTGNLSPLEAVTKIDSAIGGITKVEFQDKLRFSLTNHNQKFSLNHIGYPRKSMEKIYGMAVVAYFKAKQNGSVFPGEVHISSQASTKHHMAGIVEYWNKYGSTQTN